MNDKHTPGPWYINDLTTFDESKNKHSGRFEVQTKDTNEGVFKVVGAVNAYGGQFFPYRDEAHANAKLIAASPDLLGALKELLECDYTSGTHLYTAQIRARNAIEKATV